MDFAIGEILCDRYKIKKRLGNGYWGVTYLVADLQADNINNSECVVKQIKPAKSLSLEENEAYFEREIKALQILGKHARIPSFKNSFSDREYFYIVQEYIVGDVLKQKIKPGKRLSEKEVDKLLIELLQIVKFIHENQHIHRDLKPDNVIQRPNGSLVIIDFGTVKEINTLDRVNSGDTLSKLIGSSPYIAPERLLFPRPKEFDKHPRIDIYALGIIGLQAITGLAPDSLLIDPHNDGARLWSDAIQVSPRMKSILNKMAHPNYKPNCRYQSSEEVLQDLTEAPANILDKLLQKVRLVCNGRINLSSSIVPYKYLLLAISSLLLIVLLKQCFSPQIRQQTSHNKLTQTQVSQTLNDSLSLGEEILNNSTQQASLKKQATEFYYQGKYERAAKAFREYWNTVARDPEALIYLNNALIELTGTTNSYTLAVVVPFPEHTSNVENNLNDISNEILRGVAKAQEETNLSLFSNKLYNRDRDLLPNLEILKQKITRGQRLKIILATDRNDPNPQGQGIKTARQLVKISSLLGVIGHYTSNVTIKTVDIYNRHQITLISPTASSKKLIDLQQPRPFFFRTIPSVKVHAEALANYLINNLPDREAVIFYNPDPESFSYSYWQEFKTRFENKKGKIVLEYNNFNSPQFDPQQTLRAIDLKYPDAALVLLPDGQIAGNFTFDRAQKIIQLNQNKHWIVGAETLYTPQTMTLNSAKALEKIAIAIPWHFSNNPNSNFVRESQQMWLGNISYRTALSYDATRVFIQALQQIKLAKPTSKEVQKTIANTDFSTQGATVTIEFSPQGEREGQNVQLVTIMDCNPKIFVALERQECS